MIAAFATSSLFLVCYLVYHAQVGSVPFTRQGFVRPLYFTILITHVTLAAAVAAAGDRHAVARPQGALRAASAHRALDVSDLDVRVGDRRARLRAPLSADLAALIRTRESGKAHCFLCVHRVLMYPAPDYPISCPCRHIHLASNTSPRGLAHRGLQRRGVRLCGHAARRVAGGAAHVHRAVGGDARSSSRSRSASRCCSRSGGGTSTSSAATGSRTRRRSCSPASCCSSCCSTSTR